MKNILIISGSPRKNGNSDTLCDQFAKGASGAGHQVEKIFLGDKKLGFCTACYACQSGICPQQDDAVWIAEKMLTADVIVLSTPVYFYTMSAQLKTLIDRSVMYYPRIEKKRILLHYDNGRYGKSQFQRNHRSSPRICGLLRRLCGKRHDRSRRSV